MVGLPGRIRVRVQGIRRQPHEVDLLVPVLSETVREMIVERLSEDPRNLVRIEEGGIPSNLVGLIRELGGRLVPTGADLSAELDEKPIGFEHRVVCAAAAAAQLLEQDLKPLLVAVGLPMDDLAVLLRDARGASARCTYRTVILDPPLPVRIRNGTSGVVAVRQNPQRWGRSHPLLC